MQFAKNASKFHMDFGHMLLNSPFGGLDIEQEVGLKRIDPTYENGRHKFDYVIWTLDLVVELHGEQHFKPVAFDGDKMLAKYRWLKQMQVDVQKAELAFKHNMLYVSFARGESFTFQDLCDRMELAKQALAEHKLESNVDHIDTLLDKLNKPKQTSHTNNYKNTEAYVRAQEESKRRNKEFRRAEKIRRRHD